MGLECSTLKIKTNSSNPPHRWGIVRNPMLEDLLDDLFLNIYIDEKRGAVEKKLETIAKMKNCLSD